MTDPDLVLKKIAFIETCVTQLRTIAKPNNIHSDVREERFIEHTLQLACQSAIDIASHVVSDNRLGEPRTNRELFEFLFRNNILNEHIAKSLGEMAGFRNILVHAYDTIDLGILQNVVETRLDDLLTFSDAIRSFIHNSAQ